MKSLGAQLHRLLQGAAWGMAVLGGTVLLALIVMTCASVLGRAIDTAAHSDWLQTAGPALADWLHGTPVGAITGDFELVEAGMAFVIFAFLPYCQIIGGHASVDILASVLPARGNRVLTFLAEALFAVALIVIAVQLEAGFARKLRSGQTSQLLQMPIWWAYGACLVGAVFAAVVGVYMAVMRALELGTGRALLPRRTGGDI